MDLRLLAFSCLFAWASGASISNTKEAEVVKQLELNSNDSYIADNVLFYLYTRENLTAHEIKIDDTESLQNSTFDISRPTKVLIHGFLDSYLDQIEQIILTAYLDNQDVNIVAVSWAKLAGSLLHYEQAANNTQPVGQRVGLLIDFLVSAGGADIASFHLIGHSLGAHVASFASNSVTTGNISRISGLDPALPHFSDASTDERLDPSDADIVDCIHTCGGLYGFYDPLCTIDFYPNGGVPVQPGCWLFHLVGVCSHAQSYHYFAASINNTFEAEYCETFSEMESKKCSGNLTGLMGDPAPTSAPGIYYLKTSGSYPYVKNWTST